MKNNKRVIALLILIFPLLFTKAALANEAHRSALNTVLIERNIADIYGNNTPKLNDIHAMPLASEIENSPTRPFANNELSQAVDNHSFEFVDEPNLGFFKQERTYNVDCDAAQSDPISDNETAIMLTVVEGPTVVSFDWRVSSERNFDGLAFTVLGINPDGGFFDTGIGTTITGQVDWNTRSVRIPAGPHLVAWGYIKDRDTSVGDDTGWVDNVLIGPQGQVTPDLENPNACPGTLASIPAILQMLTADNLVIPEPPQLPDEPSPALPDSFDGQFYLRIESDSDDFAGGGIDYTYLQTNIFFGFEENSSESLFLFVTGFSEENPEDETSWRIELASNDRPLSVGVYENAERTPFHDINGLEVSLNQRTCFDLRGQFRIFEIEYDNAGNLTRLVADFERFCGDTTAGLRGSISYDASMEPGQLQVVDPLPAGAQPMPEIPIDFDGQFYLRLESPGGDFIGQNQPATYLQSTALFNISASSRGNENVISIGVEGFSAERPASEDNWNLDLAVTNDVFREGLYARATRFPFNTFNGLSFSGNGRGCNRLSGQYRIFEVEFDGAGEIQKLVVDFEQFCDNATQPIKGTFVFDSSKQVVEPATREDLPANATLIPAISQNFQGSYNLKVESEPGDFIGGGLNYSYNDSVATLSVSNNFDNIGFSIQGGRVGNPSVSDFWSFDIQSVGQTLIPGSYKNATRFPFNVLNGLNFSGNGSGCNQSTGSFRIFEISYGANQLLESITMDFEQFCDNSSAALRGSLIYDSTR